MTTDQRIRAFVQLGEFLKTWSLEGPLPTDERKQKWTNDLRHAAQLAKVQNQWFTESNITSALQSIAGMLDEETMVEWISRYISRFPAENTPKKIGVIMAGNIPLVGFHDFLCVLISGNILMAKMASDDKMLLPAISSILISLEPGFNDMIKLTEGKLSEMDAVIATGSNNSARYFEYYFGKYPHIIRHNRNSVAVLDGTENPEELLELGKDIFQYYGLGCRNVSKIYIPLNYDFNKFFEGILPFGTIVNNHKYINNYEYNKTVYLMNGDASLLDNNFLLLKADSSFSSPIGVLFYEFYENQTQLKNSLSQQRDEIQCVVARPGILEGSISFGQAQCPQLFDYADGVDVMEFLLKLN